MKILVLGAGKMGLGAAFDLAHNSPEVRNITIADINRVRANAVAETIKSERINVAQLDVSDYQQVVGLMREHDAVISCVNYWYNADLARAAVEAGANYCDLGGNN